MKISFYGRIAIALFFVTMCHTMIAIDSRKSLFDAVNAEDCQRIRRLVKSGVDVDSRYIGGMTPLIYVAHLNRFPKVASILLELGADVDAHDESGKTALMWAVENNSYDLVKILLEHDADIYKKNRRGVSAIDWAYQTGNESWDRTKGHRIRELIKSYAVKKVD